MATDPSNIAPPPPPPAPSIPPSPGASRDEWRAWRRQQHDYAHSQGHGDWYGPWGWGWAGTWGWFWGAALVLIGAYYLLNNIGVLTWLKGDVLWPSLLILLGVVLLVRRGRGWWR